MTDKPIILEASEEITLRRVAFGESPERTLRREDMVRLRGLRLVTDGKDGPCLTASGRAHFETLAKPVGAERGPGGFQAEIERIRRTGPREA
jgi:hypothetical protein